MHQFCPLARDFLTKMFHVKHFGKVAAIFLTSRSLVLTVNYSGRLSAPLDLARASQGSHVAVDRNGTLLRAFTTPDGRWRLPVTVNDADPRFIAMLIAYEDHRFYAHPGVDVLSLSRAALQWASRGHIISGGSTVTMQVARLLAPRAEKSLSGKLGQIVRAIAIERHTDKTGILDLYLSLAPYGGNIEGLRAASLSYFGREPKRLSIGEAALLVALPQSPETRRPDRFPDVARAARDTVLDRVFARGVITAAERDAAKQEAVPRARRAFPVLAAHASEQAFRRAPEQRILRLTLDAKLQASVEALAREAAAAIGPKLSCAMLVIDNASGEIRAHVGAADYFSQERAGSLDMTAAIRSPGSALKPFIYALAFENGIAHPETILDDRPKHYGSYAPENFDLSFQGTVTARHALQSSLNLPAVELLDAIGPARFIARLRNAGARVVLPDDTAPGLAAALGGLGISLRDLASLYAGLARGGTMPVLTETFGARTEGTKNAPDRRTGRQLVCRRYFARRAAAAQCSVWTDRLQNRNLLRLPRCFRDRLRQSAHDRGLAWAARQWIGVRARWTSSGGAGSVRRLCTAWRSSRIFERARRDRDEPEQRAASAVAACAQGCTKNFWRGLDGAVENRLPA